MKNNGTPIWIRPATIIDQRAVFELSRITLGVFDKTLTKWNTWFSEPNNLCLVATNDQRIVGFRHSQFFPEYEWADALRVHPNFQRQHIATALRQYAFREAERLKIRTFRGAYRPFHPATLRSAWHAGYTTQIGQWHVWEGKIEMAGGEKAATGQAGEIEEKSFPSVREHLYHLFNGKLPFFSKQSVGVPLTDEVLLDAVREHRVIGADPALKALAIFVDTLSWQWRKFIREITVFGDAEQSADAVKFCQRAPVIMPPADTERLVFIFFPTINERLKQTMLRLNLAPQKTSAQFPATPETPLVDNNFVILERNA